MEQHTEKDKKLPTTVYDIKLPSGEVPLVVNPAMMERVLVLAEETVKAGYFPYVGLLEHNGQIIAEATNSIRLPKSIEDMPIFEPPHAHPELRLAMEAVKIAEERYPNDHAKQVEFLQGITTYANCDPCTMCSQALGGALVNKIVFAITHEDASRASQIDNVPLATTESVYDSLGLKLQIVGPLEKERALVPFKKAWDQVLEVVNINRQ